MKIMDLYESFKSDLRQLNAEKKPFDRMIKQIGYRQSFYSHAMDQLLQTPLFVNSQTVKASKAIYNKLSDIEYQNNHESSGDFIWKAPITISKDKTKTYVLAGLGYDSEIHEFPNPLPQAVQEALDQYFKLSRKYCSCIKPLAQAEDKYYDIIRKIDKIKKAMIRDAASSKASALGIPAIINPKNSRSKINNPYLMAKSEAYKGPADKFNWGRLQSNYDEMKKTLDKLNLKMTVYCGRWPGVARNIVASTPGGEFVYYKYDGGPGSGQSWCYVGGKKYQLSQFLQAPMANRLKLIQK